MFLVISYLDAVAIALMALPIGTYAEIYIFLQAHAPQIYIFLQVTRLFLHLVGVVGDEVFPRLGAVALYWFR